MSLCAVVAFFLFSQQYLITQHLVLGRGEDVTRKRTKRFVGGVETQEQRKTKGKLSRSAERVVGSGRVAEGRVLPHKPREHHPRTNFTLSRSLYRPKGRVCRRVRKSRQSLCPQLFPSSDGKEAPKTAAFHCSQTDAHRKQSWTKSKRPGQSVAKRKTKPRQARKR